MLKSNWTAIALGLLLGSVTSGCFDEASTLGLECIDNSHCGDDQECVNRICVADGAAITTTDGDSGDSKLTFD